MHDEDTWVAWTHAALSLPGLTQQETHPIAQPSAHALLALSVAAPSAQPGPAYTIAGRLSETNGAALEDRPLSYLGNVFRPGGPAFSLPKAPRTAAETAAEGPGPAHYVVTPTATGPSFTIGARAEGKGPGPDLPGPGDYHAAPQVASGPAWTMGERAKDSDPRADLPAPGHYDTGKGLPAGPAFSMQGRTSQVGTAPAAMPHVGPGAYHVSAPGAGPAFSLAGRLPERGPEGDSPGPGSYQVR